MKSLFLTLGLALGVAGAAQAQSVHFGIKAGASLTNYTGKGNDSTKYKAGFHGGLFANIAVNNVFSIQPEVLYSMKGAKTEFDFGNYAYTIKTITHYVDVPVLAHINAGGLFFELGPQVGFLLAATSKQESSGQSYSRDIKDQLKTVDFGYAAGLGYQLANGPGIGLRYNGGFVDVDKNRYGNTSYARRNGAFQLYLTYMFGGK
jgi:carbohydrate-selective porin OprB